MEIYNAVIGEPERVKDDYYYRSRKGILMQEMKRRFGSLISVCRQRRGEERFEAQPCSTKHQSLVRECLRWFTPWNTDCPVPSDFNPLTTIITRLTSKSGVDEDKIEVERIHAVLHPDCFGRLIAGLGYASPEQRLEVPRFFFNQADNEGPPRERYSPADLSAEELTEIKNTLAAQGGRRRTTPAAIMRIVVDGVERAVLNPAERLNLRFSVDEDAEIIEVRTMETDSDLLLATHLLASYREIAQDWSTTSSIVLEGGQKLSLSIARRPGSATEAAGLLVDFKYEETNLLRAVGLFLRQLSFRLPLSQLFANYQNFGKVSARHIFAFACGLLVMCAVGYFGYIEFKTPRVEQVSEISGTSTNSVPDQDRLNPDTKDRKEETNSPTGEALLASKVLMKNDQRRAAARVKRLVPALPPPVVRAQRRQESNRSTVEEAYTASKISPSKRDQEEDAGIESVTDATRSIGTETTGLPLGEVEKVYIELRDDQLSGQELRRKLIQDLNTSRLLTVVVSSEEADASLKIATAPDPARQKRDGRKDRAATKSSSDTRRNEADEPQFVIVARLVNARGHVLWPKTDQGFRGRYSGSAAKVCAEMVRDLLAEIRASRGREDRRQ